MGCSWPRLSHTTILSRGTGCASGITSSDARTMTRPLDAHFSQQRRFCTPLRRSSRTWRTRAAPCTSAIEGVLRPVCCSPGFVRPLFPCGLFVILFLFVRGFVSPGVAVRPFCLFARVLCSEISKFFIPDKLMFFRHSVLNFPIRHFDSCRSLDLQWNRASILQKQSK